MASFPTSLTTAQKEQEEGRTPVLSWSVHLFRREPRRLPRILSLLVAVFVLGLCLFHSAALALLPVVVVLFSLSEYVFPIHYALTAESASARHGLTALEIRWSDVQHAYLTEEGIKLSPLRTKNSRFEPLRGVYLRFDDASREAIMETVKRLRTEVKHGE